MQETFLHGRQVNNFRLEKLLGRGGFADVYLGKHVYLQTYAALKMLRVQLSHETVDTFLQEARTIARLEHPHIVRVSDYVVEQDSPCFIMQYAPYGSLRKLHPRGERLSLPLLISYVKQIASALHYAHTSGIVHCDVKPENMLLGSYKTLLLSDFGLAVFQHQLQARRSKQVAGTRLYMAPEQWQGEPVTASDQYALAVVVFEWLTGQPPFLGSARELASQHLYIPPPSLIRLAPDLSPAVEQVLLTALHKQPQHRFSSVLEFASALEQALLSQQPSLLSFPENSPSLRRAHSLIGREPELSSILSQAELARALSSRPLPHSTLAASWTTPARTTGILLAGEAGIGKTRLAEETCRLVQQQSWQVAWSRCYEQGKSSPYQMWSELLRSLLAQGLWPQQAQHKHPSLFQPLTALLPQLVDQLALPTSTPLTEPGTATSQLRDALLSLFLAISEHAPLLVVLDDVHWSDQSSYELLGHLLRRVGSYPILFLLTYRDHELTSEHALYQLFSHLQRERLLTHLPLSGLSQPQMNQLLSHVPLPLVQRIQQQASGNPLFAEELAHMLLQNSPHTQEYAKADSSPTTLPTTITAVFEQRLRGLSPACQRLLSRAAVLDGRFSLSMLVLLENNTDEDRLFTLLEEALHAHVLTEEGSGTQISYRFWHPLLADHLYQELSAGRRQMLHGRSAQALRQIYATAEGEGAALIVHHLLRSAADPGAVAYFADLAGDRAYALSAYPEAERFYRLALDSLQQKLSSTLPLPENPEMQSRSAFLFERLGECIRYQGRPEDARQHFLHALELRSHFPTNTDLHARQTEAQLQALLCCEVGVSWYDVGDFTRALSFYEQAEHLLHAQAVQGGPVWAQLCLHRSYVFWSEGAYADAQHTAHEALALFEECVPSGQLKGPLPLTRLRRTLQGDIADCARAYTLLGGIICTSGTIMDAIEHLRAAMVIYEQQQCIREIGLASATLSDIHLRKAEHSQAREALHRSRQSAETTGDDALLAVVSCNQGILALRLGQLSTAERLFQQAVALAEKVHDPGYLCLFCCYLALALQEQGRLEEAMEQVHRALSLSHSLNSLPCLSSAFIAVARLRITQVRPHMPFSSLPTDSLSRLMRTRRTLERVLTLGGIEVETRVEGFLYLAQVLFLLKNMQEAEQVARYTLAEAKKYELVWLRLHARRLLALIALHHQPSATFVQELENVAAEFQQHDMLLEYARSLVTIANPNLHHIPPANSRTHLQTARRIFLDSHATLDLSEIDSLLTEHTPTSPEFAI